MCCSCNNFPKIPKKFRTLLLLKLVWLSSWFLVWGRFRKTCLFLDWSAAVSILIRNFNDWSNLHHFPLIALKPVWIGRYFVLIFRRCGWVCVFVFCCCEWVCVFVFRSVDWFLGLCRKVLVMFSSAVADGCLVLTSNFSAKSAGVWCCIETFVTSSSAVADRFSV